MVSEDHPNEFVWANPTAELLKRIHHGLRGCVQATGRWTKVGVCRTLLVRCACIHILATISRLKNVWRSLDLLNTLGAGDGPSSAKSDICGDAEQSWRDRVFKGNWSQRCRLQHSLQLLSESATGKARRGSTLFKDTLPEASASPRKPSPNISSSRYVRRWAIRPARLHV